MAKIESTQKMSHLYKSSFKLIYMIMKLLENMPNSNNNLHKFKLFRLNLNYLILKMK